MPIKFTCPHCKRAMVVNESLAGKKGRCKACQQVLTVPAPTAAKPPKKQPDAAVSTAEKPSPPPPPPPPPADVDAEAAALFGDEPKTEAPVEVKNIELECPFCDEPIHFPVDLAGKRAPCPNPECRRIVKVPELVKQEPKDWRKADQQRGPAGARLPEQPALEGAWGSATAGKVGQDTLKKAGVIPTVKPPRTLWQKFRLPIVAVVALVFLGGFGWGGYRWWVQRGIERAVQEALDYAAAPESAKEIGPTGQAALYLGAGDFYLHTKRDGPGIEANKRFGKALETLRSANPSDERDAVLTDLAGAWIELSGQDGTPETIQGLLLPWKKTQPLLIATLTHIQNAEARREAVRVVSQQLLARGEVNRVLSLANQVYSTPDDEKAAVLGVVGMELLKAGHQAEADRAADEALKLYAEKKPAKDKEKKDKEKPPPLRAEAVALGLVLGKKVPSPAKDATKADTANYIIGQVEALARNQGGDEAVKKAALPELNEQERFRALLALAAAAVDGKSDDAADKAENALESAKALSGKAELSWTFLRLIDIALAAGLPEDRVQAFADAIGGNRALRGRAQLAVFRARLAKTRQSVEETIADKIEPKSLSHSLAAEDLARHNARLSAGWADKVKSWPQPRKAFGSVGAARGTTR